MLAVQYCSSARLFFCQRYFPIMDGSAAAIGRWHERVATLNQRRGLTILPQVLTSASIDLPQIC